MCFSELCCNMFEQKGEEILCEECTWNQDEKEAEVEASTEVPEESAEYEDSDEEVRAALAL